MCLNGIVQVIIFLILMAVGIVASASECHVVIFNGGYDSKNNYRIHLDQIKSFYESAIKKGCRPENVHILSASGEAKADDFSVHPVFDRGLVAGNYSSFMNPKSSLQSATLGSLSDTVSKVSSKSKAGDNVLIFVVDHGQRSGVSSWRSGPISTDEFQKALSSIPNQVKVKLWAECCYCGQLNSIEKKNFCSATSTDSGHVGNYFFENWGVGVFNSDWIGVENKFSNNWSVKGNPSFLSLAKAGSLDIGEGAFNDLDQLACRQGPMNSAEQIIFSSLNLPTPVCFNDLLKGSAILKGSDCSCESEPAVSCSIQNITTMIRNLQNITNDASRQALEDDLNKIKHQITNDLTYRRLIAIDRRFKSLNPTQQLKEAQSVKASSDFLKENLNKRYTAKLTSVLGKSWTTTLETIFYSKASEKQKLEYIERKKCLEGSIL